MRTSELRLRLVELLAQNAKALGIKGTDITKLASEIELFILDSSLAQTNEDLVMQAFIAAIPRHSALLRFELKKLRVAF